MNAGQITRAGAGLMAFFASTAAHASGATRWQLNMTQGVTQTAQNAYNAHMIGLWVCVVIGIVVFAAMAVAMFKFRKSKGAVPAKWSHNTTAEIIWTVIPVLLLIVMAWPATRYLAAQYDTTESEMTVKITGYQWLWRYEYLGEGVNFVSRIERESELTRQLGSERDPWAIVGEDGYQSYLLDVDRELVLPTDTKIRFVITADDVIHSWWVPALGWKQDAIPGVINEAWAEIREPGIYRGQCAELCGKDHAFMPIVVRAVPRAEYESWLAAQRPANTDETARTAAVAASAADEG